MDGMIDGGWGFVWAAYGITWAVLLGYLVTLVLPGRLSPPGS